MIKLEEQNGLFNFAKTLITDGLEMWLDTRVGKVTLYYTNLAKGITKDSLKIKIADYIGRNMLMETYKIVTIVNW